MCWIIVNVVLVPLVAIQHKVGNFLWASFPDFYSLLLSSTFFDKSYLVGVTFNIHFSFFVFCNRSSPFSVINTQSFFTGTPRSAYETSTLDRSPKKGRSGIHANATTSMEEIANSAANNRHSAAFTASGLTSPTSPTGDEYKPKPGSRKPIGGVAVLPMGDLKRTEAVQRKTPTPTEPKQRPFSSASIKSPTSETSEVRIGCVCMSSPQFGFVIILFSLHFCVFVLHDDFA